MKIKTKLRLGFGFLFLIVLLFGATSLHYINKISVSSKVILKDNYESLKYAREMRSILDNHDLPLSRDAWNRLAAQLRLEAGNITEPGEGGAVRGLSAAFMNLGPASTVHQQHAALRAMRLQLSVIEDLNMKAIARKNEAAQASVERATTYLVAAATFCFIVLFSFSINFPGFVANPLRRFSEAIKAISQKNYKQRLDFQGNDEFAALAKEFNAMAGQLNKWENTNLAKLQSEKSRIEAIISQMQDGIIGLSERNDILFVNQVAAQLLNRGEQEVVGKNAAELAATNDLLLTLLQSEGGSKHLKIFADGKESYFKLERREILIPAFDEASEQVISEATKAAGEVFILKNETEYKELDEAKTNFIATVSHELKTPISSIKMSLKLLDDVRVGELNREQHELVAHIGEDCGRLLKITSELLDLAQVETGNLQLNYVKSDPRKIAQYAMDTVRRQAEHKEIDLQLWAADNLPAVNADTEKTAWVLVNFLSNALRYSPLKSKVLIRVGLSGREVEFSVKDFGRGIDRTFQSRLFDRYFQVPTDGQNKTGSGLGLAISKDFIMAQGGRIWVESELGEGSTFAFTLPQAD
ncbi:PAS domain-containing sensor histidine kinase [Pedobacter yulinensis]|uniref:histidine kinase n=1 Tax=Pedobacter yulinensis TaxID=2126353 RepID=A0A2T3HMM6_9SPHI|nr:ATP-binding protein [Pedobacter yulinensis]PST83686.1 PAS domain-containing sensor histidine kinase [Pedobacter yulinensis]